MLATICPMREPAAEPAPSVSQGSLILVVDDEPDMAELLCHHLRSANFGCSWVQRGRDVLDRVREINPDLIILDLVLPDMPGEAVLAELRHKDTEHYIPVVVLTCRGTEADQLVQFSLGADDYIAKPCSMKLLVARIRSILRRTRPDVRAPTTLGLGPFRLTCDLGRLLVNGADVRLTHTEFRLLREILAGRGRVVRRKHLMDTILGGADVTDRRLDVHVANLRKKLRQAAPWLITIRGVGFALRDPEKSCNTEIDAAGQAPDDS